MSFPWILTYMTRVWLPSSEFATIHQYVSIKEVSSKEYLWRYIFQCARGKPTSWYWLWDIHVIFSSRPHWATWHPWSNSLLLKSFIVMSPWNSGSLNARVFSAVGMFELSGQQNLRIADLVPKAHGNFMYDPMSAHFSLSVYLKALISPRLFAHARVCFGRVSLTIACHVVEPLVLEKWASRVCWLIAGCSICILCFSYKSF